MSDKTHVPVEVLRRLPARTIALGFVLFVLLASIYLLLYRGHPLSIDEISTFDSIESLTQRGTLARTIEFYRAPTIAPDGSPFLPPLYEPLQIIVASPFYTLAQPTPFGQFHSVFFINILVTALTAVSLYVIALRQGYSLGTAWLAALLYGTATLALPYSRWLFREPLMALFVLWAFALAFEIRVRLQSHLPVIRLAGAFGAAVLGMILTKQIGIVLIAGLGLVLIPPPRLLRRFVPVLLLLAFAVVVLLIAIAVLNPDFGDDRYSLSRWLDPKSYGFGHIAESVIGYQISPARSIWLYSPILLFGFLGMPALLRKETKWLVLGIVVALVLTSAAYGALRMGMYWSGGWNWGPRYMLPMIPLWMLFALPVIERLGSASRGLRRAFAGISMLSVVVQILGMAVPYTDFYNLHYPSLSEGAGWLPENWSLQNTALAHHLANFSIASFDSAWRYVSSPLVVLALLVVTIFASIAAARYLFGQARTARSAVTVSAFLAGAIVVCAVAGLDSLRSDRRYIGNRQDVFELIGRLNSLVERNDAVFLSGYEYMMLFMNNFKAGAYFAALPDDAVEPPGAESLNAVEWASRSSERVWLVLSPSSFQDVHTQEYRRRLSDQLYPLGDIVVSPFARVATFATLKGNSLDAIAIAPEPEFGGQLRIDTAELPGDTSVSAGEIFAFAIYWTVSARPDADFQVSVQLLDDRGVLVAQRDTAPLNGYGRTSTWLVGETFRDPYAIELPENLPSGNYTISVVVYRTDTLERIPVQNFETATDAYTLVHLRVN